MVEKKLGGLSKKQFILIIFAAGLLFYALGVESDLFASPFFSMFFIISYSTAHDVAGSIALGLALTFIIWALIERYVKKHNRYYSETYVKHDIPKFKASSEDTIDAPPVTTSVTTSVTAPVTRSWSIIVEGGSRTKGRESTPVKQSALEPTKQTVARITPWKEFENATHSLVGEAVYKMNCPTCNREFSHPMYMLDNTGPKLKLVRQCPYCNQFLYS